MKKEAAMGTQTNHSGLEVLEFIPMRYRERFL